MKITRFDLTYCQCVSSLGLVLLLWQFFGYIASNAELGTIGVLNAIAGACCLSVVLILGSVKRGIK